MYDKFSRTDKTIMFAFQRVLGRKAFEEISIVDICAEADIQRMTFYNHFESKENLFQIVLSERQSFIIKSLQEKLKDCSFETFVDGLINETFNMLENEIDRVKFFIEANKDKPKYFFMIQDSLIMSYKRIFKIFKDKIKLKVDAEVCSILLASGLNRLFETWLLGQINYSKQDLMKTIKDYVLSFLV